MKNYLRISGLFLALFAFSPALNAQTNVSVQSSPPSDAPSGYTYDLNKAMDLIIERILTPVKANEDAGIFGS
jgi:hypothetical protein